MENYLTDLTGHRKYSISVPNLVPNFKLGRYIYMNMMYLSVFAVVEYHDLDPLIRPFNRNHINSTTISLYLLSLYQLKQREKSTSV